MSTNEAMQNCGVITIEQKDMVEGQAVSIFIETGLTPRELAEQREELRDALRDISEGCSFPEDDVQRAVLDRARAALAKTQRSTK